MPPKPRIVRKNAPVSTNTAIKPGPSTLAATSTTSAGPASSSKPATPTVGAMLPPPVPAAPKAVLEPEMEALFRCLRSVTVKTGEIYAFYSDTRKLGIQSYAPKPPQLLTTSLSRELEKYDQLCDVIESQLLHAVSVLQRDLQREQERLQIEADAIAATEAAREDAVQKPSSPDVLDVEMATVSSSGEPVLSAQTAPQASPSVSTTPAARRQSTISFSSLNRPQFSQKLDLSAVALDFNPEEITGRPTSPVTLAPRSARLSSASDFPPDFMTVLAEQASAASHSVDIDLTLDDVPNMGEGTLGSSADRPIELDLDIDMASMPTIDLFGDDVLQNANGPQPKTEDLDIEILDALSTAPPAENTTEALLASLSSASNIESVPNAASTSEPPQFDMGSIDFNSFQAMDFNGADGTDMNLIDMDAFLQMGEAGPEGSQNVTTSAHNQSAANGS